MSTVMAKVAFDTLKFVKTLKKAGVPEAQAEAISAAVRESHEAAELATKADLRELELRLISEIRLVKWALSIIIAGIASLILKAFF